MTAFMCFDGGTLAYVTLDCVWSKYVIESWVLFQFSFDDIYFNSF